jgi:hypothetical protein
VLARQTTSPVTGDYHSEQGIIYIPSVIDTFSGNSYSGIVNTSSITWYKFVVPYTSVYRFYSTGNSDTKVDIFSQVVLGLSNAGRATFNDNSGDGYNFSINYSLTYNQIIYLRVTHGGLGIGNYIFNILDVHTHTYGVWLGTNNSHYHTCTICSQTVYCPNHATISTYNSSQHKWICTCGYEKNETHTFVNGSCTVCGISQPHTHSYYHHYTAHSSSQHKAYCSCGQYILQAHAGNSSGSGNNYCYSCGELMGRGFQQFLIPITFFTSSDEEY